MRKVILFILCCLFLGGCYVVEVPRYYPAATTVQDMQQQQEIREIQRWKRKQQIRGWMRGEYIGNLD